MIHFSEKSTYCGKLPEIYDLFFLENKDQQMIYLFRLMNEYKCGKNCFDVGCGTGSLTAQLAESGMNVFAIDLSDDMLQQANRCHNHENVIYKQADITKFCTNTKYNVAVSLSHVIGYVGQNREIESMLYNINRSLMDQGLFMFNFYHAPALSEPKLKAKFKQISDDRYHVTRVSNAKNNEMESMLENEYYYIIEEKSEVFSISIHEKIRYFTLPEIKYYLVKAGFYVEKVYNYMTYNNLTPNDWNGFIIARKIEELSPPPRPHNHG